LADRHSRCTVGDEIPITSAVSSKFSPPKKRNSTILAGRRFNDFLRSVRPEKLSPALKSQALSMLRKEDVVTPSAEGRIKLDATAPILNYFERSSIIELKILRVRQATSAFLAGAAVIITEPAIEILAPEELQAVVAHELAHEYFWGEYELARQRQQYKIMHELELRCDGFAVMALSQLGLDPESLISAVTKLTRFNERQGISTTSDIYTSLDDRFHFIRSIIEMAKAKASAKFI
jgi:Zn-dependent protease with chaperone function